MIIGLTGGIASGKTLVASFFLELGIPVIDTDVLARQVVTPGSPAWQRLSETFGPEYFTPEGELDRAAMAARVFADSAARRTLERITHPAIFIAVDAAVDALRAGPHPPDLIVVAVPLLFEVGAEARFDKIVVVTATPEQQRARLHHFRHYTPADADARLAAQLPLAEKVARADYVIDNTGSPQATRRQVEVLVQILRRG